MKLRPRSRRYVFQVFAQLLLYRPKGAGPELSPAYAALFPPLLHPALWERKGNVPALAKLMRAYLRAAPGFIVQGGHLQPLLGVFQKLLASKATEAHAFALLCGVLECVPLDAFTQYLPTVFQLALTRMQTNNAARRVARPRSRAACRG